MKKLGGFLFLSLIILLLLLFSLKFITPNSKPNSESNPTPAPTTNNQIIRLFSKKGQELQILNPRQFDNLKSPVIIEGEITGSWFFEGTFTIYLEDKNGNLIKQTAAESVEDWMTENWVSFRALLEFDIDSDSDASLVFQKNNPSGLPENEDSVNIEVKLLAGN